MSRKLWVIALACWMAMYAFLALTNVTFKMQDVIMGLIAAAIVVLIIVDR